MAVRSAVLPAFKLELQPVPPTRLPTERAEGTVRSGALERGFFGVGNLVGGHKGLCEPSMRSKYFGSRWATLAYPRPDVGDMLFNKRPTDF
jgi:hypothetical protein